jgi:hypothetical protein
VVRPQKMQKKSRGKTGDTARVFRRCAACGDFSQLKLPHDEAGACPAERDLCFLADVARLVRPEREPSLLEGDAALGDSESEGGTSESKAETELEG